MEEANFDQVFLAASRDSLVKHFSIIGLFGYRNLSMDSDYAATILIARNGAGKTTMMGALDAFLRCQFGRLVDLDFERIECQLGGCSNRLVLEKSVLAKYIVAVSESSYLARHAKALDLDLLDLQYFLLWEYPLIRKSRSGLIENPVFYKVYSRSSYTAESASKLFDEFYQEVVDESSPITELRSSIIAALQGVEIVYLPTYRRIELPLPDVEGERYAYRKPKSIQARLGLSRRGLHTGDMQFGLSDISARLKVLNEEIMYESNKKYAEISANIVDDLVSGAFESQTPNLDDRPTKDELDVFFDRLSVGDRESRYFGYYGPYGRIRKPDIGRIYGGNIPRNSEKFLNYFLGKLNNVIQKMRQTQQVVDEFVTSCNRYLSADDPTTRLGGGADFDAKELRIDRATLDVSVWRLRPEKEIVLDALSSGEKQMISLFARLFLYPDKKIVLIDEPELSLSLDWQRKILPDIVCSDYCAQVVAITHSPFIFDNQLDSFAKGLGVNVAAAN